MNRRDFLTALIGATAALAILPLDSLTAPAVPGWLKSAEALTVGDVFTISGVHSINPLTYRSTGHLQRFVVTHVAPSVEIWPRAITEGHYANVDHLPAHDAVLRLM